MSEDDNAIVERVARTIYETAAELCDRCEPWKDAEEEDRRRSLEIARAAIAAHTAALAEAGFVIVPKEPTEETIKATLVARLDTYWSYLSDGKLIAAALGEK